MKTLHVSVTDKIATYQKRDGDIVCGNKHNEEEKSGYQIKFIFDSEWQGIEKKIARFIWGGQFQDVEFKGDTCPVPILSNVTLCKVGVYAGNLRTTTSASIICKPSILCKTASPTVENDKYYANEARKYAEEAKRYAEQAEAGCGSGKPGENGKTPYIQEGYWYIDGQNLGVKAEGEDGKDGTSVTVVSVKESTADGGSNIVTFSDGKTLIVKNGVNGKNGKDYVLTDSDQTEIADKVITKTGIDVIPDYVKAEAETVADKILSVRNANTFVMACVSDLHTSGNDASAEGVLHAGQAMKEIQALTELDLVAVLGDVQVGDFEENTTGSFKYVKRCFANVAKGVPYMHLQGNHDELPSDTTEKAQQRYYAFIGANNVGTVTDYNNKFRNYGYRDFDNYKVRVIYINTADVSESEMTYDNNFTPAQMAWFINNALNLSSKDDASKWGVIVCGHHPLNWEASGNGSITKVLDVLNAYKGRASGSVAVGGQSINYNFTDETAEFICHIHGHLHNFREEVLGTNKVLSITVPNACFSRNNEYGNYDYTTYPEVVKRYGDDGENNDGTGTQRTFAKISDTSKDTAFSVFCIDRASKTVNVFNYGSGIDRQWDYANGVKGEGNGEITPTPSYTNLIPTSVDANGNAYVGEYGEKGYKVDHRVNSSGIEEKLNGMCCTGFIRYNNETIRLKNVTITGTKTPYIVQYYDNKGFWLVRSISDILTDDGNGVYVGRLDNAESSWIRITCGVIDDTTALTLDEPIE